MFCSVLFMFLYIVGASVDAWADAGAVSIAVGGLVARRETRVVMAKEVLLISLEKIVVDYDFCNDSDQNVTTEVAFPVPPYFQSVDAASFSDFKLSIDGKPVSFKVEVKAMFKGKDVTDILVKNKLDVASFGRFEGVGTHCRNFIRLQESEKKRLVGMGIIEAPDSISCPANWEVHLQYHWTQTFPAHSTTHIRHEYSPASGTDLEGSIKALQSAPTPELARTNPKLWKDSGADEISRFCLAPEQLRGLIQRIKGNKHPNTNYGDFEVRWVDFVLTTANTWQQPIEDFTLIVERPKPESEEEENDEVLMSFCPPQNAKVEKLDADHTLVHLTNFVPTAELHIGFFDVNFMYTPDELNEMKK
jgi:hypothetical protein